MRAQQLRDILRMLRRKKRTAILAGDLNVRAWVAARAKIGDDGGAHWHDAWHTAGANSAAASTWRKQRFDRILFNTPSALTYFPDSFALTHATESDHCGVACTLLLRQADDHGSAPPLAGLTRPLRRGARGRAGGHGVARRPTKLDSCAKMEPSTAHDAGGPKFYCGKGFEKPRIPPGEAAIIEDERRKDLWRLFLPRNSPYLNGYMALVILFLCANMDAQVVVTAKGAADYVAKYISKYGAGQSVNARIASLIDDIITRLPEDKKTTIASVMSKAFIATAVPDTLCGLEAWHLLLGLNRTMCSRGFIALQGDAEKAHRSVAIPKKPVQPAAVVVPDTVDVDGAAGSVADVLETTLVRKTPAERYCERFRGKMLGARVTAEWLEAIGLATYQAEVEDRGDTLTRRRKPKVVKAKPYLNLDMSSAQAARMARMALRLHRPFESLDDDPGALGPEDTYRLPDEDAIEQLEEFVRSASCPRWLSSRYDVHNRALRCKRKHVENDDNAESTSVENAPLGASCAAPAAFPGSVSDMVDGASDSGDGDAFALRRASDVVGAHGLRWHAEGTYPDQPYSVIDAIARAGKQQVPVAYLKLLLEALRPDTKVPSGRQVRMAVVTRCMLQLDLDALQSTQKCCRGVAPVPPASKEG